MAYIGKQPTVGNFVKLDAITTSATATYNLLNGGVAYSPQSANHCIVSLNGVIQSPNTSFTISGSTIVFASALTATDVIDFILVLGDVLNIGTPSDATVGFSKVTSNLITGATAETSIAGGDSVLIYDDSASALRKMTRTNFVSGIGGTNTPAFMVYKNTAQSISNQTATKIQYESELFDTDSAYDNATNYRFTPQVAGKYFIFASVQSGEISDFDDYQVSIRKNGTAVALTRLRHHYAENIDVAIIVEMNGTTDYVEGFVYQDSGGSLALSVTTSTERTRFGGFKLV